MSEQRAKAKHRGKKNAVREMPEEDPDFQIAPMIDVLLVLLVFFMSISSTEVLQSTKNIELPVAANGNDAVQEQGAGHRQYFLGHFRRLRHDHGRREKLPQPVGPHARTGPARGHESRRCACSSARTSRRDTISCAR